MKTLIALENELNEQKAMWLSSTTLWSDFSEEMEEGLRMHKEAVEFDFLTENDKTDLFDNDDLMDKALDMRSECLYETLQSMDLT